jgi:hypothetical protein
MAGYPILIPALFAANGASPAAGAKIYTYIKGTTTPQAAYSDDGLVTPAANPVVANSLAAKVFYLDPSKNYDVVAKTSDEATTLFSATYNVDTNNISIGTGWEDVIEQLAPWRTPIGLVLDTNTTEARATNTAALQTCIDIGAGRIVLPVGTIYYNDDLDFTNSEKMIFEGAGDGTILTSVTTGGIGFTIGDGFAAASGAANPRQLVFRDFNVGFSTAQSTNAFFVLKNTNSLLFRRVNLIANAKTWFEIHGGAQQYSTKIEGCSVYGGENFAYLIRYPQETIFEDIIGGAPMSGDGIVVVHASGVYMTRVSFGGMTGNGFATFPGVPEETFTGTGAQTAFVLEYEKFNVEVYVNSVLQTGGVDYNYSGKTVTFTAAPSAAAAISVRNIEEVKAVYASMSFGDTAVGGYGWSILSNGGKVSDISLDSVWGSSCDEDGILIDAGAAVNGYQGTVDGIQLLGFKATNNQKRGIRVEKASNVLIDSPSCTSNSQVGSGTYDGITIGAAAVDVTISGGISGSGGSFSTNNQRYGIGVASGATGTRLDLGSIDLSGNVTGTFTDAGTDTRFPGGVVMDVWFDTLAAADTYAVAKGVPLAITKAHTISSNTTLAADVRVMGGSFAINTGIALSIAKLQAPFKQVFSGLGTVNLNEAHADWFGFASGNAAGGSATAKAALQKAADSLSFGGTLWLPPGTTYTDGGVTLNDYTTVNCRGGRSGTVLLVNTATASMFIFGDACTLRNVKIQNNVQQTSGAYAYSFDVNGILVEDVEFVGHYLGVYLGATTALTQATATVRGFVATAGSNTAGGAAIALDKYADVRLLGGVISGNTATGANQQDYGIKCSGFETLHISDFNVTETGVALYIDANTGQDCTAFSVIGSVFDRNKKAAGHSAIIRSAGSGVVGIGRIEACWFGGADDDNSGSDGLGLLVEDLSTGRVQDLSISGCHFILNGAGGAKFVAVKGLRLVGNSFSGNDGNGALFDAVDSVVAVGNTFGEGGYATGNTTYGVNLTNANDNYVFIGNDMRGNTTAAVASDGGDLPAVTRHWFGNLGYVTEAQSTATPTTDGSGDFSWATGLSANPRRAFAICQQAGNRYHIQADENTFGSTTIKFRVFDMAGTAVTGTAIGNVVLEATI